MVEGVRDSWNRVVDLADRRGGAYSLLATRAGAVVAERRRGCDQDSLFYCFSVTKPIVAMAIHLLAERGQLELDQPITHYWPEYAFQGKDAITIRQVLSHRAGVPASFGHPAIDMAMMANWERSVRAAWRARPRWPAGQVVAYHVVSFGFILDELVRRVAGQPVDRFIATEFFEPLAMDTYLALPRLELTRTVPLRSRGGNLLTPAFLGRPSARRALVPAASPHVTARSLAAFYQMLLAGGIAQTGPAAQTGRRLVEQRTIADALTVSNDGEIDRTLNQPQRYGLGVQLGGLPGVVRGIGTRAPASAFGHSGSGVANVWAEPERKLNFVYLSDTAQPIRAGLRFLAQLSDAAWAAFGSLETTEDAV